jgi:hypothetical protein
VGQIWWNCEDDVWGRVGGIVKTRCAICFEFRTIKYLSGTPVYFYTYSGKSRLVYEATIEVRDFRRLWVEKSRTFPSGKLRLDRRGFAVTILRREVNKMCVCQGIQRDRQVVWFVLKTAEQNIRSGTEQETCFGHHQAFTKKIKQ